MRKSNFSFLAEKWAFLLQDAQSAEKYARYDPRAAAIYSRRTLEISLKWLYKNDSALRAPYEASLAAMIHAPTFSGAIKKGLFLDIKFIHRLGNIAAHGDQNITAEEGTKAVFALHQFLGWLSRVYTRGGAAPSEFDISLLPNPARGQKANIQSILKTKNEEANKARERLSQTEEELQRVKAELAEIKKVKEENIKTIGSNEYSESQTRELMIDVMLRETGWDPKAENVEEYEVTGMPDSSGELTATGYVDYVLWGKDGKPIALVEAKKTSIDPKQGARQAELYAKCLEKMHGQRPIIYYSNGYKTWLWDDQFYPPREVQGFSTADELQWKVNQRNGRKDLSTMQIKSDIAGRHYQMEAAARVMQAFGEERRRKSLIVMATGTGKTRLSIGIVDMLMRAGWARRVLFLADRISLVNQAKRNFKANLPHATVASLLDRKEDEDPTKTRVLFSTYPTMLNCIDGTKKDQTELFSAGHFDLIIIDEAHRSVYQKYGAIFDYFDSLLLGLTATPRGEVDRNTYKLFELDDHQPSFAYELDQAVEDGFLVPPKAISVPLKFQRDGIKYDELSPEEQEEYELQEEFYDKETGEMVEEISSSALNKWLFNIDTVNKVLAHLMENGIKVEGGDKIGKTIIFAKNSKHAYFIVEQFDKNYPHLSGKFCRKVDYSVKYAQSLIDDFSIKDKDPQIAVSVDMLDTGIDVPEIVNLVFFKIVRSKTKFWQMIGRGTRLCQDLFFPGDNKKEFLVFDYCQNFEFFDANPDGYESRAQESVKQKIFKRRLELVVWLEDLGEEEDLSTRLKDQMHTVVSNMNLDNFIVRKHRQEIEIYTDRKNWETLTVDDIETLGSKISSLPSIDSDDEFARRFDLLVLNLQLAVLKKATAQENYMNRVKKLASGLEDKAAVPAVKAEMKLILELQEEKWWQDVTLPMLEQVRLKLREIVKFVDKESSFTDVFTNFEDEIGEISHEHQLVKVDANLIEYRKRVQRFVYDNRDHLTIKRLKNNQPISRADVMALEDILFSDDGILSRKEYEAVYGDQPLGLLVRSIVGLSRKAAKEAFAEFLSDTSALHPDQITFLDQIVDYLVKNGTMEPKTVFETPFTHINDQGIAGVFDDESSKKVIDLIKYVNQNAYYPGTSEKPAVHQN